MNDMKDIIDEIKSRCEISSIISEYMAIKQSGSNYKGLCPFHGEKTPSFHINTSKQIYKCFGCGEGGDVINFVMKMENLDFMDSVKLLASKCGLEINTNISNDTRIKIEKSKKFQDVYTEAARFYFSNLTEGRNKGYDYLRKRGLSDKIIKKFGLGFSKDSWSNLKDFLVTKGYSEEELLECGLILENKGGSNTYDRFRNRVMFPIFDYRGNIIAFGGRTLDNSIPKYLNSPETLIFNKRENLYGLNFARKKINNRTIILVEGYMDLISLVQYGVENVSATLGTALTDQQSSLIKRYADNVIISYDSDSAGVQATLRAIDILARAGINAKVLNLRDSKDPDEFIRKYGFDEYKKEIENASHYIKYKIDNLKGKYNLNKDDDKVKYIKEACKIIKTLKSPIDTDYYINYLSQSMGISIDSVKREVYGNNYNKSYNRKFNNKIKEKPIEKIQVRTDGKIISEKLLLKIMLESKKLRELILLKISRDDFLIDKNKKIANFIIKNREMDKITIDKSEDFCIDEEYIEDISSMSLKNIDFENTKEIDEIVNTVKRNTLEAKIEKLLIEQKELENNHDAKEVDGKIMEIALKIVEINKMLKSL
ncbi:DNA primase [Clostridioides mangenotii]|uniref:DNA primase n=1 Tax=Metaclostridioides mangenotii TaxID=1540 RepID=UPI002149C69A|nr:DNA primase [Clostridioides mangenotii]MCR1953439.1 DNA primase [Clostridioides mangenotii]